MNIYAAAGIALKTSALLVDHVFCDNKIEAEQTGNIREACRLHNISEQTFYQRRTKFGGIDVSEARRVRRVHELLDRQLGLARVSTGIWNESRDGCHLTTLCLLQFLSAGRKIPQDTLDGIADSLFPLLGAT